MFVLFWGGGNKIHLFYASVSLRCSCWRDPATNDHQFLSLHAEMSKHGTKNEAKLVAFAVLYF